MNSYRLFLFSFMVASLTLLTGFQKPDINNTVLEEQQTAAAQIQSDKTRLKRKDNPVRHSRKKDKQAITAAKSTAIDNAEPQKALDLSIPFRADEKTWFEAEQSRIVQREASTIFVNEKKKSQPVYLDGEMLMSQEPEADKRKSLDGAGIVITLKK